jgi:hypothetical protein
MFKVIKFVFIAVCFITAASPSLAGGDGEYGKLEKELKELRGFNSQLQKQIQQMETRLNDLSKTQSRQAVEAPSAVSSYLDGVEISGMVDTSYVYNFNEPDSVDAVSGSENAYHVFDDQSNDFNIDLVQISVERPTDDLNPIGFRLDLDLGEVADHIEAGGGTDSDFFDLQQAFVSAKIPTIIGNDIDIQFGKWVTLLGAEVIEAPNNFNFSRSFLFNYAIPLTHTGILANYSVNDSLSVAAGVVNGWDNVDDNNHAKSVLGQLAFSCPDPQKLHLEELSLSIQGIHGAEQDTESGPKRSVVDVVATIRPTEDLTLNLNYDSGHEEEALANGRAADWAGIAAIINYDFTDWFSLAGRYEYFEDDDGARTGTAQDLQEFTVTAAFKCTDTLTTRLEYRHDFSNNRVFSDGPDASTDDDQDLIAVELSQLF